VVRRNSAIFLLGTVLPFFGTKASAYGARATSRSSRDPSTFEGYRISYDKVDDPEKELPFAQSYKASLWLSLVGSTL
jgi:hypothetical protein